MPGFVLHLGAMVQCAHAGQALPVVVSPRVTVSGQPATTLSSTYSIAGCALAASGSPPCVTAQWVMGATRVTSSGQPLLILGGQSMTVPNSTPLLVMTTQTRVTAT
jgi:uncharacterized Zn-binding protein involved in type VI secretion